MTLLGRLVVRCSVGDDGMTGEGECNKIAFATPAPENYRYLFPYRHGATQVAAAANQRPTSGLAADASAIKGPRRPRTIRSPLR